MTDSELQAARVVIVDDDVVNTRYLSALLGRWGLGSVTATNDSICAVELCETLDPDLLLLDLHMPALDGFDILGRLADRLQSDVALPVIVLTADDSSDTKRRALRAGARDFLTKPFDQEEVRLRVMNLLTVRFAQRAQAESAEILEGEVRLRTRHLEEARLEVVQRLARAGEYHDDDTGQHTARVGRTSGLLAGRLGLTESAAREIATASSLHDIGKIGISDTILLKPGRLSEDEFERMKAHASIGAEILSGSDSVFLQVAEQIALSHHERWDGAGYPEGLAGDAIPVSAAIVAVADVFDALTHRRPYKEAWPVKRAAEEIRQGSGSQFAPSVVECFCELHYDRLIRLAEGTTSGIKSIEDVLLR